MKRASFHIAILVGAALLGGGLAGAQQSGAPKSGQAAPVTKPKAPVKPVVPQPKSSTATPAQGAPAAADEAGLNLSSDTQAFIASRLPTLTPSVRTQLATRAAGRTVIVTAEMPSWSVTPATMVSDNAWLSLKDATLTNGPGIDEPYAAVTTGPRATDRGVRISFYAEANKRYLVICDISQASRWDAILDTSTTLNLAADGDNRGALIVPARTSRQLTRVFLHVQRPRNGAGNPTPPAEVLRRCEITPLPG